MLRVVAPAVEREREGAPRVATRLLAGAASGALAAAALNPTELLKTRMQTEAGASTTLMGHLRAVVREGGVGGLWRGSGLAMTRSAVLTATQVATYGEVKRRVVDLGLVDADGAKWRLHFAVAMLTGVVTTATTNPVDMLKTRLYVANAAAKRRREPRRRSEARSSTFSLGTARLDYLGASARITCDSDRKQW